MPPPSSVPPFRGPVPHASRPPSRGDVPPRRTAHLDDESAAAATYTCETHGIHNCLDDFCLSRYRVDTYITANANSTFSNLLIAGIKAARLESAPCFAGRPLRADNVRVATKNNELGAAPFFIPLAQLEVLTNRFRNLNPLDAQEQHEFYDEMTNTFQLFRTTIQLTNRYRGRAPAVLQCQQEILRRMVSEHCSAKDAYLEARGDGQITDIFVVPTAPPVDTVRPTPAQSSKRPARATRRGRTKTFNETITAADIAGAPYGAWKVEPADIPKWRSRCHPDYVICSRFQNSGCFLNIRTCDRVHECVKCHKMGHPEIQCRRGYKPNL